MSKAEERIINQQQATIRRQEIMHKAAVDLMRETMSHLKKGDSVRARLSLERYMEEIGENG